MSGERTGVNQFGEYSFQFEGVVEVMDKLPNLGIGWSNSVQGRTVRVGNRVYRARNISDGKQWKAEWEEISTVRE